MTSSVRFLRSDFSSNGIPAPTLKNSNFNLGANYLFSPLIRLYGAVNVTDSLGTQSVNTAAALTAAKRFTNFSGNATNLGGFRYSQHIGGTISTSNTTILTSTNQTNIQGSSLSLNLGVYMGHALDKASQFGSGILATNLNQTISMGYSPIGPVSSTDNSTNSSRYSISNLLTAGSVSWHRSEGKETTQLRLSGSDNRRLTGERSVFQLINLQATRTQSISAQEYLRGNLTAQATRQDSPSVINTPNTITTSADLNYQNNRTFKVRNLIFESILRLSDTGISLVSRNQMTRTWDNNITYRIGRLNLRLESRLAMIGNSITSWISFTMLRPF